MGREGERGEGAREANEEKRVREVKWEAEERAPLPLWLPWCPEHLYKCKERQAPQQGKNRLREHQ